MIPVAFKHHNRVLGKPPDMTDDQCIPLPIFTDGKACVSCWDLTDEEIADIVKMRQIWLVIHSGCTQPPVLPTTRCPIRPVSGEVPP